MIADPWHPLRALTAARIALGRAGGSVPTAAHLDFQLAHARARDAVGRTLDAGRLAGELASLGAGMVRVASAAADRREYLLRPDLGRRLCEEGRARLASHATRAPAGEPPPDLALIVGDGLSAGAAERHAPPLLARLVPALRGEGWRLAPIVVAERARVALGDEVARALGASLVVVLLGERPGLTAPESLGVYLTHDPRPGRVDAERNCVSNVRPEGLGYDAAAHVVGWLVREARRRGLTGVGLREEAPPLPPAAGVVRALGGGTAGAAGNAP